MSQPTHIIDPDGEVMIILRYSNSNFVQLRNEIVPEDEPAPEEPAPEEPTPEEPTPEEPTPEEPTPEEPTPEEPAPEEPTPEEPTPEEPTPEEPAPEEPTPEGPTPEEPAPEEPAPEEPAPEEPAPEEPVEEFRIQVSARHLTLSSRYFKSLLTGNWKESVAYLQTGYIEIAVENCSIDALLVILRAIHCQFYQVPKSMSFETLAQVASLADYYDCREAVDVLAEKWITALEKDIPTSYTRDVILWIWISWYFQLPSQFKQATSAAMTLSDGPITDLGFPIPQNVLKSLNDRRQNAIDGLFDLIQDTQTGFLIGSLGCGFECRSIMYGAIATNMLSKGLSFQPLIPYPGLDYRSVLDKILSFHSPEWTFVRRHRHSCSDSSFTRFFSSLPKAIDGLEIEQTLKT